MYELPKEDKTKATQSFYGSNAIINNKPKRGFARKQDSNQLLSTKMFPIVQMLQFIPLSSFNTARGKDFLDEILDQLSDAFFKHELSSARMGDPNYETTV